ncbi:MAG: ABC transporter substrate binding protein [bacterium]
MSRTLRALWIWLLVISSSVAADDPSGAFRLGFFEAGESVYHSELRREFLRQLDFLLPDSVEAVPLPQAYGNGDWKRDSCRIEARRLATLTGIDLMITMGPWVVEDLLEAGYAGPILALHRVDPAAEGLLDSRGRPVAENLTVHQKPGKIEDDLATLTRLKSIKRLGVLYFASGDERAQVIEHIKTVATRFGLEIIAPDAYDNHGTFAFFKAYGELPAACDAVYVLPLWGMSTIKTSEFLKQVNGARRISLAWEGRPLVSRGATVGNGGASLISEARYNAQKAAQIRAGATPADLPVLFAGPKSLIINETSAVGVKVDLPGSLRHETTVVAPYEAQPENYLSLREVLHQVAQQNPERLATNESLVASEHAIGEQKTAWWPQVEARYRMEFLDDHSLSNSLDRLKQTSHRADLRLDQLLFSRQAQVAIKVAQHERDITATDQRATVLDLELAATAAYLDVLKAVDMLSLNRQDRNRIDIYYEQAQAVYMIDSTELAELFGWESEHAAATNRLTQAEADLRIATANLNSLMNYPCETSLSLDSSALNEEAFWSSYRRLESAVEDPSHRNQMATRLIDGALRDNVAVARARQKVALARRLASAETAAFWPKVGLFANYRLTDRLADQPPDFFEEHDSWSLGGQIRWPLFLGGRRWHQNDKSKAQISRSEYQRDAVSLGVMDQTYADFEQMLTTAEICLRSIRASQRSGEALRWTSESYGDRQPGGFVRVNDARQRYYRDHFEAIRTRYEFWFTMAKLLHDLGISQLDSRTFFPELIVEAMTSGSGD